MKKKNNNVVIVILFVILLMLFMWVCYEKFLEVPDCHCECPPMEEANCDEKDELSNDKMEEALIREEKIYNTNTKKYYELKVYDFSNLTSELILLNNKEIKIEKIDGILYVNDKAIGENINEIYVTNYYIFTGYVATNGLKFAHIIDENLKVMTLEQGIPLGDFEATEIYLTETGNLLAFGGDYCGIACVPKEKQVNFNRINNELQIKKSE